MTGLLSDAEGTREITHSFDVEKRVRQLAGVGGPFVPEEDLRSVCERVIQSYGRASSHEVEWPPAQLQRRAKRAIIQWRLRRGHDVAEDEGP
jgi:hypothetical protein